jgi:hypothetical protein
MQKRNEKRGDREWMKSELGGMGERIGVREFTEQSKCTPSGYFETFPPANQRRF